MPIEHFAFSVITRYDHMNCCKGTWEESMFRHRARRGFILGCVFAAGAASIPVKVPAADSSQPDVASTAASDGELQEVVVTAERRTERLQDVPASVEVFA